MIEFLRLCLHVISLMELFCHYKASRVNWKNLRDSNIFLFIFFIKIVIVQSHAYIFFINIINIKTSSINFFFSLYLVKGHKSKYWSSQSTLRISLLLNQKYCLKFFLYDYIFFIYFEFFVNELLFTFSWFRFSIFVAKWA